ncbi:nucleotidyltransferase family protein [Alteromonas sp. 1_MG-2023]|uniref:nucleotidyltransferase family protein n=1 Tax=Alteromonas sp. 1_MG-2023 TaxID=3062669 RepID=UPI0026E2720E|nr:nucleotidyltransferase family protein [Alteromonas sp. 1_MG-2023]MDO6477667.1 nucleotidyltransferase family protein [Alteromonas sp. 1_MG-2023]
MQLLKDDPLRYAALQAVAALSLRDCWIGAGFIRNLIWDHTHRRSIPTPLNDVDVVYFDSDNVSAEAETVHTGRLNTIMPALNWEVRNQARMHDKHGRPPFSNTPDAVSHWVEIETTVAARLQNENIEIFSAYGLSHNYNNTITRNPLAAQATFDSRVKNKSWLADWPALKVQHGQIQR